MDPYSCILLIINVGFAFGAWSSGDEKTIRSTIFATASYDRLTRPAEITNVSVAFNLLAINTLDIKTQQLSCTGWLTLEWEDSRLTWTVTAGTESNYVFARNTEIWYPEVFIDNSLADVNVIANEDLLFKVKYDGKVDWEIPRIFTTYCEVDVTYFPFDTQTCAIEVTSWGYSTEQMKLYHLKTEVNTEDFKQHGEFIFKSSTISTAQLQETKSDGSIEYFSQLNYNLILERRPSYYIMSMILPVVLTSYLMIIVFVLPVHSGEKVGFSLTVLLAVAVLLTLILDQMPSTALYVSILSMFLMTNLVLNVVEVSFTILVIQTYHRTTDVPQTVQSITRLLAKLSWWYGCKCCKREKIEHADDQTEKETDKNKNAKEKKVKFAFPEQEIEKLNDNYKWHDVSIIMDWFLFVYSFLVTTVMTVVYMMALGIGGIVNV